ncbi:TetR/AcrR family transcriptional regulator [Derxia gummosa]|uniref:TetR/AcrR family transcriptional regulator n=1 Tax=Derxia gummosa DSM 723 TaxID=1121388 RepID=A0A8B6XB75_9BURK|nr:TetR/AcrR family transcriptional regulator [Derxia gummosa]
MSTDASTDTAAPRRRGRPPRNALAPDDTREALLRAGLAVLTEKGFAATGIDEILRRAGVPKGSFYHWHESKEAFGAALVERYAAYFGRKLDRHLLDAAEPSPLARLRRFVADAADGMARHDWRRGCLVGNLGQEMSALPEGFRARLLAVFADWEARVAACLRLARDAGEIAPGTDCEHAAMLFWTGWEGAVLRARLERSPAVLQGFAEFFIAGLGGRPPAAASTVVAPSGAASRPRRRAGKTQAARE